MSSSRNRAPANPTSKPSEEKSGVAAAAPASKSSEAPKESFKYYRARQVSTYLWELLEVDVDSSVAPKIIGTQTDFDPTMARLADNVYQNAKKKKG